jgi:hypothetical protein
MSDDNVRQRVGELIGVVRSVEGYVRDAENVGSTREAA